MKQYNTTRQLVNCSFSSMKYTVNNLQHKVISLSSKSVQCTKQVKYLSVSL